MVHIGGHERAKYTTGTRIRSSDGRGWKGLRAECWRHSAGDLGEVEVRDTEIIVMLQGNLPVRRRGDGRKQHCNAVPGTVWVCPAGVHVLRNHSNLESATVSLPVVRGALDPQRLRRVKDFIEADPGRNLTIEALANEACLSPFHFARAFKVATGMAPHSYVTVRRIERAKSWISEGRPLAAIAYELGLSSQAYFTKWFKRLVGATPGAYRDGCR